MAKNVSQYPQLARIHHEINSMFERLLESSSGVAMDMWDPAVDLFQKGDFLHLRADVPGIEPKDMTLLIRGNNLIIRGQKRPIRYPQESLLCFHCMETTHGKFEKVIRLECSIDVRGSKAKLKDGVLSVRMPIVKERRASEITIAFENE